MNGVRTAVYSHTTLTACSFDVTNNDCADEDKCQAMAAAMNTHLDELLMLVLLLPHEQVMVNQRMTNHGELNRLMDYG